MSEVRFTLYGMGSPNVRKVGLMLEELELDYDMVHIAVFKGEQFAPEFLAMNPLGKVPVLVDHERGQTILESGAILFYLAESYGRLLPANGAERYEVIQWLMVQMGGIGPMFGQLVHFQLQPPSDHPYSLARYGHQAERLYRVLDDRLATREWIAGGALSIADLAIWPWANYLEQHGFDGAAHPSLIRWRELIAARPATVRTAVRFTEAFDAKTDATRRAATPADLDLFFARKADAPPADFSAVTR